MSTLSPRPPLRAASMVRVKAAHAAVAVGVLAGLAIGCAYAGGMAAKATTVRAQVERIEGASSAGFTEEALSAAAGGLDASALAIARRHDPYSVAGPTQRDRHAELMTARLEDLRARSSGEAGLRRISLTTPARPFRFSGALDASRDLECLTQAVYYEARGEGRAGMQAVAQVVLNRARHPAFPKTICGVVFQGASRQTGCQFSFTCNGAMRGAVSQTAWTRARDVAARALSGEVFALVGTATHFHTTAVSPRWRHSLLQVAQVGDHVFYRFGGRAGASAAFAYAPAPSSAQTETPVLASLDPSQPVRQAGQAMAYSLILAQEGLAAAGPATTAPRADPEAVTAKTTEAAAPGSATLGDPSAAPRS
ncbi:cell wall hydrolase [Brevundimonas sp.]|uniref:cell wall hydrolase n=1 Tax=Brevundimonas sp. TaxID=1871086 RepID=UPI00391AC04B